MNTQNKINFDFDFIEIKGTAAPKDSKERELNLISIDAECSVLTLMLDNNKNIERLKSAGLEARDFGNLKTQRVFKSICEVYEKYHSVDFTMLGETAYKYGVTVTDLTAIVTSAASEKNLLEYYNMLIDKRINRASKKMGEIIASMPVNLQQIKDMATQIAAIENKKGTMQNLITPDKVEIINVRDLEKIPTGIGDLDNRFLGYCFGSLNIITGYNGCGKSTMLNQLCVASALNRGYKVMCYSPELTASNFKLWLYTTIANRSGFDAYYNNYGDEELILKKETIEKIDKWTSEDNKLLIYADDSTPTKAQDVLNDIERLARQDYRVFVIDNLMKIDLNVISGNELAAQKAFVNNIKTLSRKYNILIHLVAHPRKQQPNSSTRVNKFDVAGSGDITNLADYVTAITRVTAREKQENPDLPDSIIEILKNRLTGVEPAAELLFDRERKRFYNARNKYELTADYGYMTSEEKRQQVKECTEKEKLMQPQTVSERKSIELVEHSKLMEQLKINDNDDMPY